MYPSIIITLGHGIITCSKYDAFGDGITHRAAFFYIAWTFKGHAPGVVTSRAASFIWHLSGITVSGLCSHFICSCTFLFCYIRIFVSSTFELFLRCNAKIILISWFCLLKGLHVSNYHTTRGSAYIKVIKNIAFELFISHNSV